MNKVAKLVATSALTSMVVVSGMAQAVTEATSQRQAEASVTFRQSLFQLVRSNMGPLGGMAKGQIPYNEQVMTTNAQRLQQLAAMIPDYFATDTRKFDLSTDAKNDIWADMTDFTAKVEALNNAAMELEQVVAKGDKDAYRAAIGQIGASCKSCHDSYKKD